METINKSGIENNTMVSNFNFPTLSGDSVGTIKKGSDTLPYVNFNLGSGCSNDNNNDTLPYVNNNFGGNSSNDNSVLNDQSVYCGKTEEIELDNISSDVNSFSFQHLKDSLLKSESAYLDTSSLDAIIYYDWVDGEDQAESISDYDLTKRYLVKYDDSHNVVSVMKNNKTVFEKVTETDSETGVEKISYNALLGNGWGLKLDTAGNVQGAANSNVDAIIKEYTSENEDFIIEPIVNNDGSVSLCHNGDIILELTKDGNIIKSQTISTSES